MKNLIAQVDISQHLNDGQGGSIGTKYTSIGPLISAFLKNSLMVAGIIFLGLLIFGGINMIASAGSSDSKKSAQSKQTVTSAVVGLIVIFAAYFIIQIITMVTGVEILNSKL